MPEALGTVCTLTFGPLAAGLVPAVEAEGSLPQPCGWSVPDPSAQRCLMPSPCTTRAAAEEACTRIRSGSYHGSTPAQQGLLAL